MPSLPEEILDYVEAHTTPPPEHLRRLADETQASLAIPEMLTGTVEGRFLEMLVFAMCPRHVLELGTYSGYSSLSMAAALPPGGRIITCELSEEHAAFARRHIEASPYADRIEIRLGPALDTIATFEPESFDLIFVDADKPNYLNYYEAVLPLLAPRGILAFDNTLWGTKVLPGNDDGTEHTATLRALNERLVADERVVCVLLPIRDGVTLVRRA